MESKYDINIWYQNVIKIWYHNMISKLDIKFWYQDMISKFDMGNDDIIFLN